MDSPIKFRPVVGGEKGLEDLVQHLDSSPEVDVEPYYLEGLREILWKVPCPRVSVQDDGFTGSFSLPVMVPFEDVFSGVDRSETSFSVNGASAKFVEDEEVTQYLFSKLEEGSCSGNSGKGEGSRRGKSSSKKGKRKEYEVGDRLPKRPKRLKLRLMNSPEREAWK